MTDESASSPGFAVLLGSFDALRELLGSGPLGCCSELADASVAVVVAEDVGTIDDEDSF